MANPTAALKGGASGAMTGASIGTSILPGWGTAIGAVGGALLGAAPSLLPNEGQRSNEERLRYLQRMQEIGSLGLTPQERDTMMARLQDQSQAQLNASELDRRRMLATSAVTGAGQGMEAMVQREEVEGRLQSQNALAVEEENLKRKRELENEIMARRAAKGEAQVAKQAAVGSAAQAGIKSLQESKEADKTVFGTTKGGQASDADWTTFKDRYGLSDDNLSALRSNPQALSEMEILFGGAS